MKTPSLISGLALAGAMATTGISGCNEPTGEQAHLTNATANSKLNAAHQQLETCVEEGDQATRTECLKMAIAAKNRALNSAGLSSETEKAQVVCTGEDPCSIRYEVNKDLCKLPDCQISVK